MAIQSDITQENGWIKDTDTSLRFTVTDSSGNPQNMGGWALIFEVFTKGSAASAAVISKTTGAAQITITNGAGTNDYATVTITDDDTSVLPAGVYTYVLRRTDANSETILAYGNAHILSNRGDV